MKDKDNNPMETDLYKEFVETWGRPQYEGHNPSAPVLVKPTNTKKGNIHYEKGF